MGVAIDPEHPTVAACAAGIAAEMAGRPDEARAAYAAAWERAGDAYGRAIAAHYVARLVPTPEERHAWNATALREADSVVDRALVAAFLPSLHLNLGHSCEEVSRPDEARGHYRTARERLDALPDGPYAAVVRGGLDAADARLAAAVGGAQTSDG